MLIRNHIPNTRIAGTDTLLEWKTPQLNSLTRQAIGTRINVPGQTARNKIPANTIIA
jgi:hypothetical protein